MIIKKTAIAGTLESSDAQVIITPGENGIVLSLQSSVIQQYGNHIREVALETLDNLNIKDAEVKVVDHGALDCTLKARIECAVYRSAEINDNLPWEA
jgi:citrate lyase subunit gamma (acyl carrier protein)